MQHVSFNFENLTATPLKKFCYCLDLFTVKWRTLKLQLSESSSTNLLKKCKSITWQTNLLNFLRKRSPLKSLRSLTFTTLLATKLDLKIAKGWENVQFSIRIYFNCHSILQIRSWSWKLQRPSIQVTGWTSVPKAFWSFLIWSASTSTKPIWWGPWSVGANSS